MTEKDLLKQLKELRRIKPNINWAISARANLVRLLEEDTRLSVLSEAKDSRTVNSMQNRGVALLEVLFKKLPSFSLVPVAILALLLVFSINLFSFEGLKFGGLALKNSQNQIASTKNDADNSNSFNNVNNITNPATEGVANARLEQLPVDTLASVKVYDDDVSTAFRAMLVERINRITVLGEELKDFYIMNLAAQAQEMYELGDYDSALRILIYTENLLGLN